MTRQFHCTTQAHAGASPAAGTYSPMSTTMVEMSSSAIPLNSRFSLATTHSFFAAASTDRHGLTAFIALSESNTSQTPSLQTTMRAPPPWSTRCVVISGVPTHPRAAPLSPMDRDTPCDIPELEKIRGLLSACPLSFL